MNEVRRQAAAFRLKVLAVFLAVMGLLEHFWPDTVLTDFLTKLLIIALLIIYALNDLSHIWGESEEAPAQKEVPEGP